MARTVSSGTPKIDQAPAQYSKSWADLIVGKLNQILPDLNTLNNSPRQQLTVIGSSIVLPSNTPPGTVLAYLATQATTINGNSLPMLEKGVSSATISIAENQTILLLLQSAVWYVLSRY